MSDEDKGGICGVIWIVTLLLSMTAFRDWGFPRLEAQRHAYHNDKRVFCCHVNGKIETYQQLEKQG